MASVKVHVTDDDIRLGKGGDCERCAVARAIRRVLDRKLVKGLSVVENVKLYGPTPRGEDEPEVWECELPTRASNFVDWFDAWKSRRPIKSGGVERPKPFSFSLRGIPAGAALAMLLLFLVAGPASAQTPTVQNPTLIAFTPSPDHATITSYKVEIVSGAGAVIQTLDIGKPAPCTANCPAGVAVGEASATINVQPVAFGAYTVVMRSVGGGITGPASPPSEVWQRAPGAPSKPVMK